MLTYIFTFIFISGLIVFSSKRKHLLLILLRLEFIVLSLYINIFYYFRINNFDFFFIMIFLTIRVCEGALGLSILIRIIRIHGNDYIISLTFLW